MSVRGSILLYLAIVVAGSAALDPLIVRAGGLSNPGSANWVTAVMWTPALAAVVALLAAKRPLASLGWRPLGWKPLLIGWTAPIVYGGLPFLIAGLLGAGTFSDAAWTETAAANGLPPNSILGLVFMAVVGTAMSLISATGEEIGWRGFLVPALGERLGFWAVSGVSAVIWALYHLPLILFAGYAAPGVPLAYSLTCFAAMVLVMSPLLTALRLRSHSFWPTALMHASHNLFIQSIFAGAFQPTPAAPRLVGEFGALTPLAGAVVVGLYLWRTGIPKTAAGVALKASGAGSVLPPDREARAS